LVGVIHFWNSGGKADFVLITLIVICFAPWLGHVFESIGKDGVKFRVVQDQTPIAPVDPLRPSVHAPVASNEGVRLQVSEATNPPPVSGTVDATRRPDAEFERAVQNRVDEEIAARTNPPFESLPSDAKKILATLWKYQRKYFPDNVAGRWTFAVQGTGTEMVRYASGLVLLYRYGFVGMAANNQAALTDAGFNYCQQHSADVANWPDTYDKFDN
jgi:hypothetical protein